MAIPINRLPDLPPLDHTSQQQHTAERQISPHKRQREPAAPPDTHTAVDPKTGLSYEVIPDFEIGADGRAPVVVDIDPDDMTSAAKRFLPHLRVPPDREEQNRLREERAKMSTQQNIAYDTLASHDDNDTGLRTEKTMTHKKCRNQQQQ